MRQLILKSGKYLFLFVIVFTTSNSCENVNESVIPSVQFSFTINLNIANDLTIPGNSLFFPGAGYGGVIVYCEHPSSYYAFDASCTNEISQSCIVENEGVLATCPCCGSQFVLISGSYPSKGPAELPLRQYNVSIINNSTLRVYN